MGFTHSDLLRWQIDYAGGSLNVNGTIMQDTYRDIAAKASFLKFHPQFIMLKIWEKFS